MIKGPTLSFMRTFRLDPTWNHLNAPSDVLLQSCLYSGHCVDPWVINHDAPTPMEMNGKEIDLIYKLLKKRVQCVSRPYSYSLFCKRPSPLVPLVATLESLLSILVPFWTLTCQTCRDCSIHLTRSSEQLAWAGHWNGNVMKRTMTRVLYNPTGNTVPRTESFLCTSHHWRVRWFAGQSVSLSTNSHTMLIVDRFTSRYVHLQS